MVDQRSLLGVRRLGALLGFAATFGGGPCPLVESGVSGDASSGIAGAAGRLAAEVWMSALRPSSVKVQIHCETVPGSRCVRETNPRATNCTLILSKVSEASTTIVC